MNIRIHRILKGSRANGPGTRNVVWFQGCKLGCPACFNPLTHDPNSGKLISTHKICDELLDPAFPCEGITVSGGEPFQQPEGLLELLRELREKSSLPVLVFSGYTRVQLQQIINYAIFTQYIDALICGPYRQDVPPDYSRFSSSGNQELVLLSGRYKESDFTGLTLSELIIEADGTASFSGIHF